MKRDRASRTAAWVAVCRGLGVLLPEEARLCDDPFGARFGGLAAVRAIGERAPELMRRAFSHLPGGSTGILYMQVRTRVLDDELRAFVASGGRQVVLLGAGFDCRAARFARELGGGLVFEVDHPATQARKRQVVGQVACARYLAWDFESRAVESLPDALAPLGHDRAQPTLTIWEGVTPYLTEPAIEATCQAVVRYSAPGSRLAFTYFDRTLFTRPTPEMRLLRKVVARLGEPFRFAWDPRELPGWLAQRGLRLAIDRSMQEWASRLLPPRLATRRFGADRRIAVAIVD